MIEDFNSDVIEVLKNSEKPHILLSVSHWPMKFGYDMSKDEIKYEGSSEAFKNAVIEYLRLCDAFGAKFERKVYDWQRDRDAWRKMKIAHIRIDGKTFEVRIWSDQDKAICDYGLMKQASENPDGIDEIIRKRDEHIEELVKEDKA